MPPADGRGRRLISLRRRSAWFGEFARSPRAVRQPCRWSRRQPPVTSATLAEMLCAPSAAVETERAISEVAARCCSTAAETVVEMPEISRMVRGVMPLYGIDHIHRGALNGSDLGADLLGRLRGLSGEIFHLLRHHSETLPASPARAASMVALRASRLVWPAISLISPTTSPMRLVASPRASTLPETLPASSTALPAISAALRDLLADLADRGGQFLRGRGDGIDIRTPPARKPRRLRVRARRYGPRGATMPSALLEICMAAPLRDWTIRGNRTLKGIGQAQHRVAALFLGAPPGSGPAPPDAPRPRAWRPGPLPRPLQPPCGQYAG